MRSLSRHIRLLIDRHLWRLHVLDRSSLSVFHPYSVATCLLLDMQLLNLTIADSEITEGPRMKGSTYRRECRWEGLHKLE